MRKRYISWSASLTIWLTSLLLVAVGCQRQELPLSDQQEQAERTEEELPQYDWIKGEAYFKVNDEGLRASDEISTSLRSSLRSLRGGEESAIEVTHAFNIGGEYEPAQRRHGLHKWFKVTFDESMDVNEVIAELKKRSDIDIAHGGLPVKRAEVTYTPVSNAALRASTSTDTYNKGYSSFDKQDPYLRYQWHYVNEGKEGEGDQKFTQGADINLFEAWKVETGKSSVIVAVIDGAVYYDHPDLKESMWVDKKTGKHGYNFYKNNEDIEPDFHGTHVAGTIGARNNNGIGVCGVAGGDGTPESGVRLMSLQIFRDTNEKDTHTWKNETAGPDGIGKAFQYAAEHGAVIANCSWGFSWKKETASTYPIEVDQLIKEGIDYFIKNAGCDPYGVQKADSPMKGGIIFLAQETTPQKMLILSQPIISQ